MAMPIRHDQSRPVRFKESDSRVDDADARRSGDGVTLRCATIQGIRDKTIGARLELFRQISRMDGSLYFVGLVGAALSRCSRYA